MADLKNNQWLVDPTKDVQVKWVKVELQSKKSRIVRLNQDIEDLKQGQIVKLEAEIIMLEREILNLQEKLSNLNQSIDV